MAKTTPKRKKAVALAKEIAKTRDGYQCQRPGCFRSKATGYKMDGSHIMPETYHRTCADPDNIIALCSYHHTQGRDSWHQSPLEQEWFNEKFPGRYERLQKLAISYSQNPFPKIDWDEVIEELKNNTHRF